MIRPVYSIHDVKTKVFDQPMCFHNDESALRSITAMAQQVPTMRNNPDDFKVYRIGSFDDSSGKVIPDDVVHFLCSVLDLVGNIGDSNNVQEQVTKVGDESPV